MKEERLKAIRIENEIWIVYIGIIILSWLANSKEKKYILYNDLNSKCEYQKLIIIIFTILLFIYYYFVNDSYNSVKNLNNYDSNKKKVLTYASFIGSFLVLISGIIFLGIAITDENIDTEIAFN